MPLAERLEDHLRQLTTTLRRLTREHDLIREALSAARCGESPAVVEARLHAHGIPLTTLR